MNNKPPLLEAEPMWFYHGPQYISRRKKPDKWFLAVLLCNNSLKYVGRDMEEEEARTLSNALNRLHGLTWGRETDNQKKKKVTA